MDTDSSLNFLADTSVLRDLASVRIARGMTRHLAQRGFACLAEVTLPNGRRADLMAIGRGGEVWIVEIKSSVADFRADQKWPDYRPFCDKLFFATHADLPESIFPDDAGLFFADGYDAYLVRDCAVNGLNAATRKALLVLFGQLAAYRLARFVFPDYGSSPAQP